MFWLGCMLQLGASPHASMFALQPMLLGLVLLSCMLVLLTNDWCLALLVPALFKDLPSQLATGGVLGQPLGLQHASEVWCLQEGGELYTWGGKFTWVDHKKDKSGNVTTKRDHHRGSLGLGDTEGRLAPVQ